MSASSCEWIKSTLEGPDVAAATSVRVAFVTHDGAPASGDWNTAELADGDARILVGPGGTVQLAAATYRMWVEITAVPEVIRRPAGLVKITA
jgi:NADPH-dependent ferric siderophore reductase